MRFFMLKLPRERWRCRNSHFEKMTLPFEIIGTVPMKQTNCLTMDSDPKSIDQSAIHELIFKVNDPTKKSQIRHVLSSAKIFQTVSISKWCVYQTQCPPNWWYQYVIRVSMASLFLLCSANYLSSYKANIYLVISLIKRKSTIQTHWLFSETGWRISPVFIANCHINVVRRPQCTDK